MKSFKPFVSLFLVLFTFSSCTKSDASLNETSSKPDVNNQILLNNLNSNSSDGRYIIVFKKSVINPEEKATALKQKHNFGLGHIYKYSLKGFSAYLNDSSLNALRKDADVDYVEPDFMQSANSQVTPTGVRRIMANKLFTEISSVDVDVAVIDSGVDINHPDLNVVGGVHFYSVDNGSGFKSFIDSKYDDDYGHGTHVAGIIGALNNDIGVVGVAPGCRIWAVKVLDKKGDGYTSDIIKALDWIAERSSTIEVVNMSLGGTGTSKAYREAIKNCVSKGVIIFVAAGNSSRDIFGYDNTFGTYDDEMPAAFPEVATISAYIDTDGTYGGNGYSTPYGADDTFGSFSNFSKNALSTNPVVSPGKGIDLVMPGNDIYSTAIGGKYEIMSGTSQAAPHAAGLAALYIFQHGRAMDSSGVYSIRQSLIDNGIPQSSPYALINQSDPDGNFENLGWVNSSNPLPSTDSLLIRSITPSPVKVGATDIIINGAGFNFGVKVSFENGAGGKSPIISNLSLLNSETISATVYAESSTPYKLQYWDIRITNLDGTTLLLKKYFIVDQNK